MADTEQHLVSQSAYAKLHGVGRKQATMWKHRGLLVFSGDKVDVNASDELLREAGVGRFKPTETEKNPDTEETTLQSLQELLELDGLMSTHEAERVKENYLALTRKIQFEKESGKLVEIEPVKKRMFELWRRERDAWLTWPDRVSGLIAAELKVEQSAVVVILEKYVREHLAERSEKPADLQS